MDNALYRNVNSTGERMKNKLKDFILQNLLFIVLFFNVALEIVSKLYRIGFTNPFSIEFFLELAVSTTTSMICYMCFIPFGKNSEKENNPSFKTNIALWGDLSDAVRTGFNKVFRTFCVEQLDVEREDKRRAIICNNTIIDYETYESEYKGKTKAHIKTLVKSQKITRKEARAINKANGNTFINRIKVKPINPVIILSGVRKMQINDAGRADNSYTANWLISRPFVIFASNAILSAITTSFVGGWQNAIFDMFLSVLTIVLASVFGYSAGVTSVRKDNDKVKSRILFLSLFVEKYQISVAKSNPNGKK